MEDITLRFVNGIYSFYDENGVEYSYKKNDKYRYFSFILWSDSWLDGWENVIDEVLEIPYAYCIHNQDLEYDKDFNVIGKKKTHAHVLIAFPNGTTTYKMVLETVNRLGDVRILKNVISLDKMYKYLIHDLPKCREEHKHQYSEEKRITGNGFDINNFIRLSDEEKLLIKKSLTIDIMNYDYQDYGEFIAYCLQNDENYYIVATSNQKYFESIIKSQYFRERRRKEAEKEYLKEIKSINELVGNTTPQVGDEGQHENSNTETE